MSSKCQERCPATSARFVGFAIAIALAFVELVQPAAAQEDPFTITLETDNRIDLRAAGVPPSLLTSPDEVNGSIQGTERSQCAPVEERQSSGSARAASKTLRNLAGSLLLSLTSDSFAQGGHYRTCDACLSSTCIGIHGTDTNGFAHSEARAVATIRFRSTAEPLGDYELVITTRIAGTAPKVTLQDGNLSPVPFDATGAKPITLHGTPGAVYYVTAVLSVESSDSGGCCNQSSSGNTSIDIELLDPLAKSRVISLVKKEQAESFRDFQTNPSQLNYFDARMGIRRDLTKNEFDAAVQGKANFYDNLGVVTTIQVPTPDGSAVVSFDCVVEQDQPALRGVNGSIGNAQAPIDPEAPLRGNPIQPLPDRPIPKASPDPSVQVVRTPDPSCPEHTVPIPRVSPAEALSLNFKNALREVGRSPTVDLNAFDRLQGRSPPAPAAETQHRWAHAAYVAANHGAAARLNVWSPRVLDGDMSLSQIWVVGGSDDDRSLQTVEAGWQVMSLWQTPFSTVFAFSASDDYGSKSCYATKCHVGYDPPRTESFVFKSNKAVIGRPIARQSTDGGGQMTVDVKWYRHSDTGDWWLQVDNDWIGFYPVGSFNGGPLSKRADYVDFGGETAGILPTSEMGSGRYASDGPSHAAFQSRLRYFDLQDTVRTPDVKPIAATADCYTVAVDGPNQPEVNPGKFLFFGGPGTGHFRNPPPNPHTESCQAPRKP